MKYLSFIAAVLLSISASAQSYRISSNGKVHLLVKKENNITTGGSSIIIEGMEEVPDTIRLYGSDNITVGYIVTTYEIKGDFDVTKKVTLLDANKKRIPTCTK